MKKRRKPERSKTAPIKAKRTSAAKETAAATPNTASDPIGLRGKCLVVLFLVVIVLIPYGQVVGFDFVGYDDNMYVSDNARVSAGLTYENIVWAFTTGEASNWHPLTWLSYFLDAQLFGAKNAAAFHLINVLFHAINGVLLFLLLHRMTRALGPSVLVAALFAVHPLHVESVAWISERKDVLSTFFWLLTMLAYLRYVASPGFRYLLVVLPFVLGLMAKPMLVTLPAVLLLMDYWPLGRLEIAGHKRSGPSKRWTWLVIEKLPLIMLAVVSSVITILVQKASNTIIDLEKLPLWLRAANAVVAYVRYMAMTVIPVNLTVFYPHPGFNLPFWQVIVSGAILVAISMVIVRLRENRPYLLVGWLWYLGTLVPVIGLIQNGEQALADRYTYIPSIGLYIMLLYGVADLVQSGRLPKKIFVGVGTACVAALMIGSVFQVHLWRNTFSLFSHALEATSNNYLAYNLVGFQLLDQGHVDEGKEHFQKAIEIKPDYVKALNNLGAVLTKQERYDEAEANFLKSIQIQPDSVDAYQGLGAALLNQGRVDEAKTNFLKAIDLKPDSADAYQGLGVALVNQGRLDEAKGHYLKALELKPDFVDAINGLGFVLLNEGRLDEAKAHFLRAIELKPDSADAYQSLGAVLANQGRPDEAKTHFLKAIELKPDSAKAYQSLGASLVNQGRPDEAKTHFLKALEIDPDFIDALNDLGNLLMNQGNIEEGKAYFLKAIEIKPDSAIAHQSLGAALANQGKLDEAKIHFLKALELQPDAVAAHNNLGALLVNQGNVDEGKAHLLKAVALQPNFIDAHINLGVLLRQQGNLDEAKAHFRKVLEIKPDSAVARKNLDEMK